MNSFKDLVKAGGKVVYKGSYIVGGMPDEHHFCIPSMHRHYVRCGDGEYVDITYGDYYNAGIQATKYYDVGVAKYWIEMNAHGDQDAAHWQARHWYGFGRP